MKVSWIVAGVLASALAGCSDDPAASAPLTCPVLDDVQAHYWINFRDLARATPQEALLVFWGSFENASVSGQLEFDGEGSGPSEVIAQAPDVRMVRVSGRTPDRESFGTLDATYVMQPGDAHDCLAYFGPRGVQADFRLVATPTVDPGQGILLEYAGFLADGTLAATNMDMVDVSPAPRSPSYAFDDQGPLRAYVYDSDPSERPAAWNGPNDVLGMAPALATAFAPVDRTVAVGYSPLVRALNEAVKDMAVLQTKVVLVDSDDGYPSGHPLHGESLVFLIGIRAMSHRPCPAWLADEYQGLPGQDLCQT